jgi:hypothetical protein
VTEKFLLALRWYHVRVVRPTILILSSTLALACTQEPEPEPLLAIGEGCEQSSECESGLCQHLVCMEDPDGPYLILVSPDDFDAFDTGLSSVNFYFSIDTIATGDQVMMTIDPGEPDEITAVFGEWPDVMSYGSMDVPIPGGLSDGPHRVLVQVVNASGEPYPNRNASEQLVIFVRDAVVPSTPQVAIHWPPPGHEYRAGEPIDVEVGVLPGSFVFSNLGDLCQPIIGCTPAFAPECEDTCGPVSRAGTVALYVEEDFPMCLADEPIGCEFSFVALLTPGFDDAELLDGYMIHGPIMLEPGEYTLTAALSYSGACAIYPNKSAAMYDQIPISVR